MSGFGNNISRKSTSKKGKGKSKSRKNRNQRAIARYEAGATFAMLELAMEYQLEEALRTGNYLPDNFFNE